MDITYTNHSRLKALVKSSGGSTLHSGVKVARLKYPSQILFVSLFDKDTVIIEP